MTFTVEEFYVPKIEESNELLYKFHTKSCHTNYKELKKIFYEKKIGYIGFDLILQEYINQCPVWVQTSKSIHRLDPIVSIKIEGPDFRYIFNITYLNNDMATCFRVKNILSIMDVFIRKGIIYGIIINDNISIKLYIF